MAKNKLKNGAFEMEDEDMDMDVKEDDMDDEGTGATPREPAGMVDNVIEVTSLDMPELEGLQVGDTVSVAADGTIESVDGDNFTIKLDVFKPSDMAASGAPSPDAGAAGGGAGAAGGGLAGLLGG